MVKAVATVQVITSHPVLNHLAQALLEGHGIARSNWGKHGVATLVLDFPLGWSLSVLEQKDSIERARTVVATQSGHTVYLDCIASYHPSGVVLFTDEAALIGAIYAATSSQRSYQWQSGLTYMELRVTRLLLLGLDTRELAKRLSISHKTVNAHVSNILCKLGHTSRAQYIATLLGQPLVAEGTRGKAQKNGSPLRP